MSKSTEAKKYNDQVMANKPQGKVDSMEYYVVQNI